MNISVKGEYALQAIFDLSLQPPGEPVKIADIARRQKIPQKFLELILAEPQAGRLRRIAPRRGGRLSPGRAADQITVGEVLRFVEDAQENASAPRRIRSPNLEARGRSHLRDSRSHHVRRAGAELERIADPLRAELGDLNGLSGQFLQHRPDAAGAAESRHRRRAGQCLAKIEGRNPAYSVKCRIGASMIWDAERRGILKPGKELIEPTSGNTGIALAFVAAARGYKITLLMPETMSIERRKVLKALGAKLILTDGALGMGASIERAEQMVASEPGSLRAAAAIPESGESGDSRQDHRARKSGTTRRATWTRWSRASAPAAPSPAFRATSSSKKRSRFFRSASSPKAAR